MDFSMIGPGIVLALGCLGSAIGCGIAGMASHGVMSRVEEGHAKYVAFSAAASTQSIFGFLLMILMSQSIKAGTLSPISGIGIGLFVGTAIMFSADFSRKMRGVGYSGDSKESGFVWDVLGIAWNYRVVCSVCLRICRIDHSLGTD